MQTIELAVAGMTCGSCAASVTKALRQYPGVADVEVNLQAGWARVHGQGLADQVPKLLAALDAAGFEASLRVSPVAELTGVSGPPPAAPRQGGCGGGSCCCR